MYNTKHKFPPRCMELIPKAICETSKLRLRLDFALCITSGFLDPMLSDHIAM